MLHGNACWGVKRLIVLLSGGFRYKMDFATVVTENSDIFTSCPGKTDVRGKGSQFETAFNFIGHVALQKEAHGTAHVMCIDSDLKGRQTQLIP